MLIFLSFVFCSCSSLLFAQNIDWDVAKNHPIQLLNKVVDEANEEHSIQDTQLDGTTSAGGGYSGNPQYRLTNTLEYLKNNIHPYIQRIVFIGLALATILLIYNGFMMVTNLVNNGEGELSKVKNNFIYIGIGVVILTGFYYLIDIVVAVINLLFG
ncbi:MAG: hypothetical protein LBU27_04380 [Candidatus Peribacteria bacterium]|nr:hypothetical protein [Candidatus Peribacteria bacterium]